MGMKARPEGHEWLDIDVHYYETCTREPEDDGWDIGDYDCQLSYVSATLREGALRKVEDKRLPKPGDTIYVAIEVVDEGCTFGSKTNVPTFSDWFHSGQEASKYIETAPVNTDYFGGHVAWRIEAVTVMKGLY